MSRCSSPATITPSSHFSTRWRWRFCSPANIAQSIRTIMRDSPNVEVLMDEVIGFDVAERRLSMKSNATLEYDYLVLATGSTHSYFGKDEWAKYAPGLKDD